MADNFGICECGDPSCKCAPGKCDCKEPADKHLPKENKGPLKDHTINLPVDPATYLNSYYGDTYYNANPPKGPYQALKSMEIPIDTTFYKDKQAAVSDAGKQNFPFWAAALKRLQGAVAENVERQAEGQTRFISRPCTWKVGKDGTREVSYNFVEEVRTDVKVTGSMASSAKSMTSYASVDRKVVLSKHMDDASAKLACEAYNQYLGLK